MDTMALDPNSDSLTPESVLFLFILNPKVLSQKTDAASCPYPSFLSPRTGFGFGGGLQWGLSGPREGLSLWFLSEPGLFYAPSSPIVSTPHTSRPQERKPWCVQPLVSGQGASLWPWRTSQPLPLSLAPAVNAVSQGYRKRPVSAG